MPVVSKIQNGFTSGELDPKLRARTDIGQYYTGAAKMRNVLVIPQGAAKRRPGMEYIDKLPTGNIKMIPFTFSTEDHYLCILTNLLLTIYKNGEVMDTVTSTITDAQIPDVEYAQSYDTLLIFHREFSPIAFIRASETSWSTSAWPLNNIPTCTHDRAITTSTLTIVNKVNATIDFSEWVDGDTNTDCKFTSSGTPFVAGDVGSHIRGSAGGYAHITVYTSTSVVRGDILAPFTNTAEGAGNDTILTAGEWALEDPSWDADRGYPRCGAFFQGRLWMANTQSQPNTVWASRTNYETDFGNWLPMFDDNGIEITSGGGVMSEFQSMYGGQHLVLMADSGQYYIPISKTQPVTPTNASIVRNSADGIHSSSHIVEVGGNLLFLRHGGSAVLESAFNFAQGSYINTDLSLLSSHLLNDPKGFAYRKQTHTNENDYILVVNGDGTLAMLSTLRVQNVTAWTMCETEGNFVAVGVDHDEMYFAVDRTINDIPTRTLERFNDDLVLDCAVLNQVDAMTYSGTALTYDGVPLKFRSVGPTTLTYDDIELYYEETIISYGETLTTLTHLGHLNNQEVSIVADNTVQPKQTVVNGSLTLARPVVDVQAGLAFPIVDTDSGAHVYIETMPVEAETDQGSSVGKKKRVIEATVMLYETSHCTIKRNKVTIRQIGIDPLGSPVPKVSENITTSGLLGWDDEVYVSVGQTLPLPFQLLGLAYKVRV